MRTQAQRKVKCHSSLGGYGGPTVPLTMVAAVSPSRSLPSPWGCASSRPRLELRSLALLTLRALGRDSQVVNLRGGALRLGASQPY